MEGRALSLPVGVPGCPPSQSHNCSSTSLPRSGSKEEKLMTKVVWGLKSRAKRERESGPASLEGGVHSSVDFYNL